MKRGDNMTTPTANDVLSHEVDAKGSINIAPEVIETIARIACEHIEGALPINEYQGSFQAFFSKANSVRLYNDESGQVVVEMAVVSEYGRDIPKTMLALQKHVKETIYEMTDILVDRVNVVVCDLAIWEQ
ncbi:Asp23/Gls24 family envelope stress response protein [Aerococcus urinae]|nr:Asp23/Gls24 family envelope stress response protein [Aerococcus urinae]MDK6598108.1 Asp23/Gls24 family envelope stress response protein [Aerococcus urinae]MDK8610312.1 Asp23/Gls24 family envelope stress response protein [Aerococcus urinae]